MAALLSGKVKNPTSAGGYTGLGQTQAALGNTPTTATGYTLVTVNNIATYTNTLGMLRFQEDTTSSRVTSTIKDGNIIIEATGTGSIYLLGPVIIPNVDSDSAFKGPVKAATTASIDLIGGAPIEVDGYTLESGNRVLVKDQVDSAENGIYVVSFLGSGSNGTWVRSSDANTSKRLASAIVSVTNGDTNSGRYFYTTFKAEDTIDVDGSTWYQIVADKIQQLIENKELDNTNLGVTTPGYANVTTLQAVSTANNTATIFNVPEEILGYGGALTVQGGAGIGGNLAVAGPTRIFDGTTASSTWTGALTVAGGLGVNGAIYARAVYVDGVPLDTPLWNGGTISDPFYVANIEEPTNTMTGALKVLGGAGIGGDLFVGKGITLESRVQTESVYFRMRNTATNGQSYTWRVGGNNFAGQGGTNLNEGGLTLLNDTTNQIRLAVVKTSGNLLVGPQTDNGVDKLQVSGSVRFGDGQLFTRSTSINNTSTTVIDSFPAANYRTAKILVQIADGVGSGANFHVVEIVVLVDNNGNVYKSEYGIITTGGAVGEFDVDYNIDGNGLVRLLFTANVTSTKQVKVVRTSISR